MDIRQLKNGHSEVRMISKELDLEFVKIDSSFIFL